MSGGRQPLSPTKIKALREALGLTQEQMAERVGGVSRVTIWRWESGDAMPTPAYRRKLIGIAIRARKGEKGEGNTVGAGGTVRTGDDTGAG